MQLFKNASIKRKQVLVIMLTTSAALLLACIAFAAFEIMSFRSETQADHLTLAKLIGNNTEAALNFRDQNAAEETLGFFSVDADISGICIYSSDGEIFAQYDPPYDHETFVPPSALELQKHWARKGHLWVAQPIVSKGETIGTVYVESNMVELYSRLKKYAVILSAVFAFSMVIAFFISARLQRVISDPILELARTARSIAQDRNYSIRVPNHRPDEIGTLINGFNEMLEQIQQRDANLERRVAERTAELTAEIAERGRAEEALRLSEAGLANAQRIANLGSWEWNLITNELQWSDEVYCIFGMEPHGPKITHEEFIAKIHPDDREKVLQSHRDSLSTKLAQHYDYRILRPDNVERIVHGQGEVICDETGQPVRMTGILQDITQRKQAEAELEKVNRELIDTSRTAGMAEVATGVLHNVGNVLNSVNVSASILTEKLKNSKLPYLALAVDLIKQHSADLGDFITNDPKGKRLPGYIASLSEHFAVEQETMLKEVVGLRTNIEHIKDIVATQQSYAKFGGMTERIKIVDVVEDALRMNESALLRHDIQVTKEYAGALPEVIVDRHKVIQILVNLIRNAKFACEESRATDRRMTIGIAHDPASVRISVKDNGIGIPQENLTLIFNHGFTTRKNGHGFGLHSGALAAKEMRGALIVQSEGRGKGATFTLELPRQP
jgi:PAS domain S-box-containing protein